jgi:hypothetical protein
MVFVEPRYVPDFARAGLHIHDAELGHVKWWRGPDDFDLASIDNLLHEYLEADDQALLLPRIPMGYAEADWWRVRHPGEVSVARSIETGEVVQRVGEEARHHGSGHSFASEAWLNEAAVALQTIVRHMESADYGGHMLGYHIGGGITTEWFAWNTFLHDLCEDYSRPMVMRFRAWLAARYGAVGALREAWENRLVDFETAAPPDPRGLVGVDSPYLRTDRQAIDYLECFSETTAAAVERLTTAAKEACGWRKVVGTFFGYAWPHWNVTNPARSGHAAMRRVFELPSVDFIISPYHYDNRWPGGYDGPQTLPDAIAARGKLYVHEIDSLTHLAIERARWRITPGAAPRTPEESVGMLARDFAAAASARAGYWWMDVSRIGWFDDPTIMQGLGRLRKIEEELFQHDWASAAEVAVVFSPASCLRQRLLSPIPQWYLGIFRQWSLSRMGAPFDTILLDDLLAGKTRNYRLYIFPNTYYLTDAARRSLRGLLAEQRAWALWFHAPGCLSETGAGVELSSALTGIRLVEVAEPGGVVTFAESADPLLQDIRPGSCYGVGCGMRDIERKSTTDRPAVLELPDPAVAADDPESTVLGLIYGTRLPGLVIKRAAERADVFSAAPAPPWRFMRNLVSAAGGHIWCRTGDIIYADSRFVAVHAASRGRKILRLPRPGRTTDLQTGAQLGDDRSAVRLDMNRGETALVGIDWLLGDCSAIMSAT